MSVTRCSPRAILAAIFTFTIAGSAHAYLLVEYPLDDFAWNASTIVVAHQPDVSSPEVIVVESWLGDVATGTAIRVPALATYGSVEERTVGDGNLGNETLPPRFEVATGARMILFLEKLVSGDARTPTADLLGEKKGSLLYLAEDIAFAPERSDGGGAGLYYTMFDEGYAKKRIDHLRVLRTRFDLAMRETAPNPRCDALVEVGSSDVPVAVKAAIDAIVACGEVGLPALLELRAVPPTEPKEVLGGDATRTREYLLPDAIKSVTIPRTLEILALALRHLGDDLAPRPKNGAGDDPCRWREARRATLIIAEMRSTRAKEAGSPILRFREKWLVGPGRADDAVTKACDQAIEGLRTGE